MKKILIFLTLAAAAYAQKARPQRVVTFTAGGTADAITGNPSPALSAYSELSTTPLTQVCFTATATSTGAVTVNLNTLGAKSLKKVSAGSISDVGANDIVSGQFVCSVYLASPDYLMLSTPAGNLGSGGGGGGGIPTLHTCVLTTPESITTTGDFTTASCSIPANTLVVGSKIRIEAGGFSNVTTAGSIQLSLYVGGTLVSVSPRGPFASAVNDLQWYVTATVPFTAVGASGTAKSTGVAVIESANGTAGVFTLKDTQTGTTINTTSALTVRIRGTIGGVATMYMNHLRVVVE